MSRVGQLLLKLTSVLLVLSCVVCMGACVCVVVCSMLVGCVYGIILLRIPLSDEVG